MRSRISQQHHRAPRWQNLGEYSKTFGVEFSTHDAHASNIAAGLRAD
jgi:hypothetical protein